MAALSHRRTTTSTASIHRLFQLATTRFFHTTAVAQPQLLDFDYEHCRSFPSSPTMAEVDSQGSRTFEDVRWIFIGDPYSKKHVYAHLISKLLRVPHISITSLLRQDLSPHSPLYKQIAEALDSGKLVPENIIFGLLSKRLEDGHDRGESGFILDGIPRTRLQAEILDKLVDIDLVVNFKCSEDPFQTACSPPGFAASRNKTKSSFSNRSITTEESEPKVSTFYKKQMQFLEEYYQSQKKLIDFQVGSAPRETWKGLLAALHLQHTNAIHSSPAQKLTTGFKSTVRG